MNYRIYSLIPQEENEGEGEILWCEVPFGIVEPTGEIRELQRFVLFPVVVEGSVEEINHFILMLSRYPSRFPEKVHDTIVEKVFPLIKKLPAGLWYLQEEYLKRRNDPNLV